MIHFTQYLRPNGVTLHRTFEASREVEALADELVAAGYRFEVELLSSGHVHMDCCGPVLHDRSDDGAIALELCDNGPPVEAAVERLVRGAHAAWKAAPP